MQWQPTKEQLQTLDSLSANYRIVSKGKVIKRVNGEFEVVENGWVKCQILDKYTGKVWHTGRAATGSEQEALANAIETVDANKRPRSPREILAENEALHKRLSELESAKPTKTKAAPTTDTASNN